MQSHTVPYSAAARRRRLSRPVIARAFLIVLLPAALASSALSQQFINANLNGSTGWSILDCAFGGGYDNTESHTVDGSGCVWLNNSGTAATLPRAEQELTGLTAGEDYTVDFWAKSGSIFDSGDPLRVQLDGITAFTGPNSQLTSWTHLTFDFVAASSSTNFSVQAEVLADSDYKVDDFNLTPAAPEPVSLIGLASLVGIAVRARGRTRVRT